MCQFRSAEAVFQPESNTVKLYFSEFEDSHTNIRKNNGLKEVSRNTQKQTPLEYVPCGSLDDFSKYEFKFDDSRPDWWTDDMTDSATVQFQTNIKLMLKEKILAYKGSLYLRSLTSLPEGVTLEAGDYLDLRSLTSLPEGVTLKAGGSLYLNSLTSLPEGVTLKAGGVYYAGTWHGQINQKGKVK
jgi:hypothetical protein